MSEIVTETRKIEYKTHKGTKNRDILFCIDRVQGLEKQGWQPIATTYVSVERLDDKHSFPTTSLKAESTIVWSENVHMEVSGDASKVRFELRRGLLKNKSNRVLGTTDTFDIRSLLKMQSEVGEERDSFIKLVVKSTPSTDPALTAPKNATLSLNIREMRVENPALTIRLFLEECRKESLESLRLFTETMVLLRKLIDSDLLCLLDIILGTLEGSRKIIANPVTKRIDKTPAECFKTLNDAFIYPASLSAARKGKSREIDMEVMKDMLCGTVKTLRCLESVLRTPTSKFHAVLENRVTIWAGYLQKCGVYLTNTKTEVPTLPVNNQSKRQRYPDVMTSNEFSTHDMVPMELPTTDFNFAYDRPDLVRAIAEWVYTPPDNFGPYSTSNITNIFCLSGAAGSGKTQLASRITYWLRELECLGGYFSFNGNTERSPGQLLDVLPMTLVHQARTVQPDTTLQFTLASAQAAPYDPVVDRFEQLFIDPLKAFEAKKWSYLKEHESRKNPIDPLIFVVDDIGSRSAQSRFAEGTSERKKEEQDEQAMLKDLVKLLTAEAMGQLPPYVKFLVLCRSDTGLDKALKEKNVGVVSELGHIVQFVEGSSSSRSSPSRSDSGLGSVPSSANARTIRFTV